MPRKQILYASILSLVLISTLGSCSFTDADHKPQILTTNEPGAALKSEPSTGSDVQSTKTPFRVLTATSTTGPSMTSTVLEDDEKVPTATKDSRGDSDINGLGASIVVNHGDVDAFDVIPDEYIAAASQLRMVYIDRSVGKNIDDALNCLSFPSVGAAPNYCSRTEHPQPEFEVNPSIIAWSRSGGYDRSNWEFETWSGDSCSQWYEKIECFIGIMQDRIDRYDVASYQLSYLAVDAGSSIIDKPGGYFYDNPDRTDVYDQTAFESEHPDTTFIYWTTSLARGIGSEESDSFNQQMRQFAAERGKVLFDVADILSHTPDGVPCYDNRDGVRYSNGNRSEDYPDDGEQYLAICPQYATETDGGHLGSVAAGKIRVAKAFWVLMARIAGWK